MTKLDWILNFKFNEGTWEGGGGIQHFVLKGTVSILWSDTNVYNNNKNNNNDNYNNTNYNNNNRSLNYLNDNNNQNK